jgi:hypothetical protein
MRFAIPSSYGTLTHYFPPVLTGAPRADPLGFPSSGGSKTFTITSNAGHYVAKVLVDGVSKGAINSYTFSNVTAPHTISATFVYATGTP